jgi:hypothetical protein
VAPTDSHRPAAWAGRVSLGIYLCGTGSYHRLTAGFVEARRWRCNRGPNEAH